MSRQAIIVAIITSLAVGFGIGFFVKSTSDNGGSTATVPSNTASIFSGNAVLKSVKDKNLVVEFDINGKRLEREVAIAGAVITKAANKSDEEYQKELAAYREFLKNLKPDPFHPEDRPVPPQRNVQRTATPDDLKEGGKILIQTREDILTNRKLEAVTILIL
jgi:hypothetical protein